MTTNHTPGPWHVADAAVESEDSYICGFGMHDSDTGLSAEEKANQRLIASAPDLLAALEAVLAERGNKWDTAATSDARAAIAAAKGE